MPPVPAYAAFKKEFRRRAAALGFEGRGSRWARQAPDTWEVIAIEAPPQAQIEARAVRFQISVEVTLHLERLYWKRIHRNDDPGPPRDSLHALSCWVPPDAPADTLWTASESTDPLSLADRVWVEFERTGVPFLQRHASAAAIRWYSRGGISRSKNGGGSFFERSASTSAVRSRCAAARSSSRARSSTSIG